MLASAALALWALLSVVTPSSSGAAATASDRPYPYGWTPSLQHHPGTNWEILVGPHAAADNVSAYTHSDAIMSSPDAVLKLQIEVLKLKLHLLRQQLGACQCKGNDGGVTDTGGFCLKPIPDGGGEGMNGYLESALAQLMAGYFNSSTVLDLGCGLGQYGRYYQKRPKYGISWTGFDGSENIEVVTKGRVKYMDLAKPQWLGEKFDWVVALEVGEHIPAEYERTFLHNIARHADKGVILSWAVPGQKGHHHVNNQNNSYVKARLKRLGLESDGTMEAELRAAASPSGWFVNTVMAFRRIGGPK